MKKVNIVVVTLRNSEHPNSLSQWGVPFASRNEANKYAAKACEYWRKTGFIVKVTVQNAMPIRLKVGKDWRKAGIG